VVAFVTCLIALVFVFTFARGALEQRAATSSDPLVSHQLSGLADPFNKQTSTLHAHSTLFQGGLMSGVMDPLGHGITSTNLAGSKIGNQDNSSNTEVDISNVFVSLGTFGGLAYLALNLLVLRAAMRAAVRHRDAVSLAALGALVLMFGQWLNGGYWAVSPLIWATAGFVVAGERGRN
jgi:cell division protein FtsW (lipid II flippase)